MKSGISLGQLAMFVSAAVLTMASAPYVRENIETRRCAKRLGAIHHAARVWANGHEGQLPTDFVVMSNELANPRLLICPEDDSRYPAESWSAFISANSSYQLWERAPDTNYMSAQVLHHIPFVGCKIHGNYIDALGTVSVRSRPIPSAILLLPGLALVVLLARCLWHRCRLVPAELPDGIAVGPLLPRLEQVRRDYLAARGVGPNQWYRKSLLSVARQAKRALAFFGDRKGECETRG